MLELSDMHRNYSELLLFFTGWNLILNWVCASCWWNILYLDYFPRTKSFSPLISMFEHSDKTFNQHECCFSSLVGRPEIRTPMSHSRQQSFLGGWNNDADFSQQY